MDIVAGVLEKELRRQEKYKSINVEKHLNLEFDLGTLLATDPNDLDLKKIENERDDYILNLSRDNTQLLFNKIWELPTERLDETIVVTLPEPIFVLPRSQRVPKPRPLTKWQQFAKDKGITKTKKNKATWDETLQKWVPLYGYKRATAQKDKDWLIEVPQNVDPMKDMFAAKADVKSEKVAKNELQRLKNIARATKVKIPRIGLPVTSDKATANQLATAVTVARSATASVGKFQPRLPKEQDARGRGVSELIGNERKRKAAPPDLDTERKNNLNLVDGLSRKTPRIDMDLAVSKQLRQEQQERSEEKRNEKPKAGRKKPGKGGKKAFVKKAGAKPVAGKGQRNPSKRNVGRKRR